MHLKLLISAAALLAVSACGSAQKEDFATSGTGSSTGAQTQGITSAELQPAEPGAGTGSPADSLLAIGDRIFFDLDRSDLSPEAQATLRDVARWMAENPGVSITLEGHADERGTREYNLALGSRRANAAHDYLVALGVNAQRLNTVSYGKERPEVPGSSEVSWAQNRRSVFVVQ